MRSWITIILVFTTAGVGVLLAAAHFVALADEQEGLR
jgi:hypothetical protein